MTSAYTVIDITKPNAATQSITALAASANSNDVALWYMVVMGGNAIGFAQSISGGTNEEPLYYLFTNGAQVVRATNTWVAGYLTQQVWQVSQDTGATWASVCTQTLTYDGATGAVTATTNAGGMMSVLYYLIGKVKAMAATVAAAASAVAGLGTMSTQAASSVAITGGSATLAWEREGVVDLGSKSGAFNVDWQSGGLCTINVTNAAAAISWQNLPSGHVGYMTLEVTCTAVPTALFTSKKPGAVALSWTSGGLDIVTVRCHDGSNVTVCGFEKDQR